MEAIGLLLERVNLSIGAFVKWLVLVMLLIQFAIVVARYAFGIGSIAAQEAVLYLHAAFFMLGAGYTLAKDAHVRVDVLYSTFTDRLQRQIDLFGHLVLLIPTMLAILYWSWPAVRNSWKILEGPLSVGGIKGVFLLKTLIPLFCILLMVQSLAWIVNWLSRRL